MRCREALNKALREEMEADENVLLMGEDIGVFQGAFKVTAGLLEEFGEKRVRDTPISENTTVGMGVGAAMIGLRPVVELMTINFSLLAMDSDREPRRRDPLHVRRPGEGAARDPDAAGRGVSSAPRTRTRGRPTSCTCPASWWPCRARPRTQRLLKAAIRDDNPVVFIEHETLYGQRGEVPENGGLMRFGEAAIRREGDDVTIIGISRMAITAGKA